MKPFRLLQLSFSLLPHLPHPHPRTPLRTQTSMGRWTKKRKGKTPFSFFSLPFFFFSSRNLPFSTKSRYHLVTENNSSQSVCSRHFVRKASMPGQILSTQRYMRCSAP
ncbi:unnamed protein product [Tuber melanosporum]|uniref:(Perigord truffle) hypothetical protein n=1 Tax=Tuber melanosporum (strain Mel28) TaxID=656061 RepID=D5G7I8_TUBMM|nr:uncharacterized protein GSTUM_00002588001 [Tuber melanosporum]CAZ80481.1 unnamed protein product [Tuber melanosporum]